MHRFTLRTDSAQCLHDITGQVNDAVRRSGIDEGVCHVYVPHTTAGLIINENADPGVIRDILEKLEELVPTDNGQYHHNEPNAHSHIKSTLVGPAKLVPVSGGRLALGRWQAVFFAEFDGPREREVQVTMLPAATAGATAARREGASG